ARIGCAFTLRAASANRLSSRPVMATRAPAPASTCAMARPMPLLPPVINAVAFCRFMFPPVFAGTSPDSCEDAPEYTTELYLRPILLPGGIHANRSKTFHRQP